MSSDILSKYMEQNDRLLRVNDELMQENARLKWENEILEGIVKTAIIVLTGPPRDKGRVQSDISGLAEYTNL